MLLDEGKKQIDENIEYYRRNAQAIRDCFKSMGYDVYGGVDSPYVWLKTPGVMNHAQFFDPSAKRLPDSRHTGLGLWKLWGRLLQAEPDRLI